jgi:NAD(P)H dehydrogenase (quinone)
MLLVTGTGGQLGSRTLAALRSRGAEVTGGSRTPGDGVRRVDFDDPASLDLRGVSTLVLVSAGYAEDDEVIARHGDVVDAARRDGVTHVVYTSVTGAGDHLAFALAHRATERLLAASDPGAHRGKTYDLVGDPITADDVAARLGVAHRTIGLGEYRARLHASPELLPFQPAMLASIASSVRHGFMGGTGTDLRDLLQRAPADPLGIAAGTAASLRPRVP